MTAAYRLVTSTLHTAGDFSSRNSCPGRGAQNRSTVLAAFHNAADMLNALDYNSVFLRQGSSGASSRSQRIARRRLDLGDDTTYVLMLIEELT